MEEIVIQIGENEYKASFSENDSNSIMVNDTAMKIELLKKIDDRIWSLAVNNDVFLIEFNLQSNGDATLFIDGFAFNVKIINPLRQQLKKFIKSKDSEGKSRVYNIKAPMPGLIVKVLCTQDNNVNIGDNLIIIEAMKMENALKAPVAGKINKVFVNEGETVEKDYTLIEIIQLN